MIRICFANIYVGFFRKAWPEVAGLGASMEAALFTLPEATGRAYKAVLVSNSTHISLWPEP